MDETRRNFFKNFLGGNILKLASQVQDSFQLGKADAEYFQSFETSYPLISEYMEFVEDEIRDLKIDPTGKSKLEIAEEIYRKKGENRIQHTLNAKPQL